MSETDFAILGSILVMAALFLGCGGMLRWFMIEEHAEHQAFLKTMREIERRMREKISKP